MNVKSESGLFLLIKLIVRGSFLGTYNPNESRLKKKKREKLFYAWLRAVSLLSSGLPAFERAALLSSKGNKGFFSPKISNPTPTETAPSRRQG